MHTEIVKQINDLPVAERVDIVEEVFRGVSRELKNNARKTDTLSERRAAFERLRGSIKMKNPPMTKQEVRDAYYGHLAEKYK